MVAESASPADLGTAASASSAVQCEGEVLLKSADELLAVRVSPVLEYERVLKHAICGPAQKPEMLRAMGQAYDAEVQEVSSKADSLRTAIGADSGAIERVNKAIKFLQNKAAKLSPTKVVDEEVRVWTWTSTGYVLASVLLLALGINSTAMMILGSGVAGFDSPLRAYTFTFLPAAIAIAFAGVGRSLSDVRQLGMMRWLFGLGLVFAVAWVVLFAQCFAGFAQQDPAVALSRVLDGGVPTTPVSTLTGPLFLTCGVLAEAFIGAGCALAALRSTRQSKERKTVSDPEYDQINASISALTGLKARLETRAACLLARTEKLKADKQDYLNKATEFFVAKATEFFVAKH